jgi:hypothetical protein
MLFAVAVALVGASATLRGVTSFDGTEYELVPAAFTAATLKVYAVPFTNPITDAEAVADTPSSYVVHVPAVQYCTM